MSLSLRFAAGSHTGMIRDHNEDSGYAGPRLLAIADGMGGQAAGEVASSEVISTLVQLDDDIPGSDILTSLDVSVQRANDQLRSMVAEDPRLDGMGTTLTALLWTGQRLGLVHVGDSRAYLLRGGELLQITQDHTWVQRLVDEGRITEEEATTHPQRSLLMRALGSADHIEADLSIREVRPGDRYLLCSDGLSGVVSAETLRDALSTFAPPGHRPRADRACAARRRPGQHHVHRRRRPRRRHPGERHPRPPALRRPADRRRGRRGPGPERRRHPADPRLPRRRARPPPGHAPGAPASGVAGPPTGAFGAFTDADYLPARPGRRALKSTALIALALIVVGGGLYAGYRWTQGQYYIGANGDHVALYQGVSQDLGPLSLSSVEKDHPEIQLDHLPEFQRSRVEESISTGSLGEAETRIAELAAQAEACRLLAEQERANEQNEQGDPGDGKDAANPDTDPQTPSLSERQRELARDC